MQDERPDNARCTDPPPRPHDSTPPAKAVRTITRNGNSLTVGLPGIFQRALSIGEGDRVELVLDREWGGYFVRPLVPRGVRPVTPVPTDRLSEVA